LSFGCILAFFAVKKDNMTKMHIIIGQLIPNAQSTTNLKKNFFLMHIEMSVVERNWLRSAEKAAYN